MKFFLTTFAFLLSLSISAPLMAQQWTKPKLQKLYMDFLKKEGYKPEIDGDGDISFERKDFTYFIIVNEKDPTFFMLALANIWKIEDNDELARAYLAANHTNNTAKVAKTYVTEGGKVWITVEMFMEKPADFKGILDRSLRGLDNAVAIFAKKMKEDDGGDE